MRTDNDIRREALKCFRRLSQNGAYLAELRGRLQPGASWGVFTPRNGFARPVSRLDADYIDAFADRGWIAPGAGAEMSLTPDGLRWYRRAVLPDGFQDQHRDRVTDRTSDDDGNAVAVDVNRSESPLTWLRARRDQSGNPFLSDEQFDAGERLRRDFEAAQLQPHVTANWDFSVIRQGRGMGIPAPSEMPDRAVAAHQRVNSALAAVGPELGAILIEVCCLLNGMSGTESSLGLPKRSGKVILLIALNSLARHYGLLHAPRSGFAKSVHWGRDGYRPEL